MAAVGFDDYELPPISQIQPRLYIGDVRDTRNEATLRDLQISAVISMVADSLSAMLWTRKKFTNYIASTDHLYIQCEDSSTQNLLPFFEDICTFIDARITTKNTIVHCERGISRSPTAVIAYLMWKQNLTREEATVLIRKHRKIRPNPNFRDQLDVWGQCGYCVWEDEARTQPKSIYASYLEQRASRLMELGLTGSEPIGEAWQIIQPGTIEVDENEN